MAEVLEDQLGLVHGWLLSVPCKVCVQDISCILLKYLPLLLPFMLALCSQSILDSPSHQKASEASRQLRA